MIKDRIFSSKASIEFQIEQAFKNGSEEIKICIKGSNGEKVSTNPILLMKEFQSILNKGEDYYMVTRDKNLLVVTKSVESAVNILNKPTILDVTIEKVLFENSFTTQYIIKGVDVSTTNEEIESSLLLQGIYVHKIIRFTRKGESTLSTTVLIKELGKVDRKFIMLDSVPYQAQKFIEKPKICNRCLRVGHFQTRCNAKEPKCQKCGENHEEGKCSKVDRSCFRCGSLDHSALDIRCPVVKEENDILNFANEKNVSLSMAKSLMDEEREIKAKEGTNQMVMENTDQGPNQISELSHLDQYVDLEQLGLKGLINAIEELTEAMNTLANVALELLENHNNQTTLNEVEKRNNSEQAQLTSRSI